MSARIPDRNGWFEIPANPISKAGVFAYKGSSIGAPEPNRMYQVYRSPEELSKPDTINSFRLVPFIIDHVMLGDPEQNDARYTPAEIKGVHGVTGDNIWFNTADNTLYGNLKVFSTSAPKAMANGKIDLSLGYRCKYLPQVGLSPDGQAFDYIQTDMIGNHVALVDDARCNVSVMDGAERVDSFSVCFDAKEAIMVKSLKERNPKAHTAIVKKLLGIYTGKFSKPIKGFEPARFAMDAADDEAASSEPSMSDVVDILGDVLPQLAEINAGIAESMAPPMTDDDMEPVMDAAGNPTMDSAGKPVMKKKEKPVAKPDDKTATAMDAAEFDRRLNAALKPYQDRIATLESGSGTKTLLSEISKRDALANTLKGFVGTFDHSEMTLADVGVYGVKKLELPGVVSGQEVSAVNAWLHGRQPVKAHFGVGLDKKDPAKKSSVDKYLDNSAAAA